MHNTFVFGILNSHEPVTIGKITDISLGGAKCANYEIKMEPANKNSFHSIDLIAGRHSVLGLPCKLIWDAEKESEGNSKLTQKRLYGIRFGKLTPKQTFLLEKLIDICISEGIINSTSRTPIAIEEE